MPSHTLRNLIIFTAVTLTCGWAGYGLDRAMNNPPDQSLGMLLWLVAPLGTALLLRAFAGDGWQDFGLRPKLSGNRRWYLLSLALYPASAIFVVGLGVVFGLVTFPNFSWGRLLSVVALGLLPAFIKNIFEEFAWRGYLWPKLSTLPLPAYVGHTLVGLIWGAWHLPYWLFYLSHLQFQTTVGQGLTTFLPLAMLNLIAASIAYNELRTLTGSVWPAVLMHSVGNALVDVLLIQGFVALSSGMGWLASPTHTSVLSLIFFGAVGVWLHRQRASHQNR